MSGIVFEEDRASRNVTRFLLMVQILAVGIVLALILFQFYSLALSVSCITFLVFAGMALWLYGHYQKIHLFARRDNYISACLTSVIQPQKRGMSFKQRSGNAASSFKISRTKPR